MAVFRKKNKTTMRKRTNKTSNKKKKFNFDFKKGNKKKLIIYISVGVVVCATLGLLSYYDKQNQIADGDENGLEMYTIPENEKIFINGTVVPKNTKSFDLAADTELSSMSVTDGQSVTQGALLYTSKNNTILAQVDGLKEQIATLKKTKNATPNNTPENKVIINGLDSDITKLNNQITALNNKAYVKTTAPFAGKVYLNNTTSDTTAGDDKSLPSLLTLQSNDLYMKGKISEQDFPKLSVDQTVDILVFSTNAQLTGRVSNISERPSDQADDNGTQGSMSYYDVNIQFDSQEDLVNGFHLQASMKVASSAFKVPSSAVLKDANGSMYVLKNMDGIMKKQIVDVSSQNEETAIIRGGLQENDVIILAPTTDMKEGDAIPGLASGEGDGDGSDLNNPFADDSNSGDGVPESGDMSDQVNQ
ncbi:MAG: efflux RND transporter periplasmic adaptor subunit [Clostridioides sp.]|nr:efflux RND transporter periplasmic adaptor subunit [Clostridioides sp.]